MKVDFQPQWLLLLASLAVLILLREHKLALSLYAGFVILGLLAAGILLPARAARAEGRFQREALRLLAADDHAGLQRLAAQQWLIRRFGRRFVISETLAGAAAGAGDGERACELYEEALRTAPAGQRDRLELNLAEQELAASRLVAAEGRARGVLARDPQSGMAKVLLARAMLLRGEDLEEAQRRHAEAVELCDPRLQAALDRDLAHALEAAGLEA